MGSAHIVFVTYYLNMASSNLTPITLRIAIRGWSRAKPNKQWVNERASTTRVGNNRKKRRKLWTRFSFSNWRHSLASYNFFLFFPIVRKTFANFVCAKFNGSAWASKIAEFPLPNLVWHTLFTGKNRLPREYLVVRNDEVTNNFGKDATHGLRRTCRQTQITHSTLNANVTPGKGVFAVHQYFFRWKSHLFVFGIAFEYAFVGYLICIQDVSSRRRQH